MSASNGGPTHCPKCGEEASSNMRACPAFELDLGDHEIPKYARWNGAKPMVTAKMLFPVLDAAYQDMARSR